MGGSGLHCGFGHSEMENHLLALSCHEMPVRSSSEFAEGGFPVSRQYELLRGESVLGIVTLDPNESDFPWFVGWFEPSPGYAEVEPLVAELSRMTEDDGFTDESGELLERVMGPGVWMQSLPDGERTEVVGINIDGHRVSWRI